MEFVPDIINCYDITISPCFMKKHMAYYDTKINFKRNYRI